MQRQTAVLAVPGQTGLRPLFRELTFSVPVLEAHMATAGTATLDPFLFRHLASWLDARMLAYLTDELVQRGSGTGDASGLHRGPALHLNLTLPGILSDAFTHFAAACRARGIGGGAEIALTDICADHDAFLAARERIRAAGFKLVVDGVSTAALALTAPEALRPDLLKLDWSPRLPNATPSEQAKLAVSLERIGPGRIVLQRAETERAIEWGLRQGIRRFQGRQVDAMLAAARMRDCAVASGCTLGQCIDRGRAVAPALRRGCRNLALLDGAQPALVP
jgi:hypothetical protein